MAKWAHPDILDGGPLAIKNGATKMMLIASYAPGESLATVTARRLAEVAMNSGDYAIATSGTNRQLTTAAGKSAVASAASTSTDLHLAFVDATRVLWVTDETSNVSFDLGTGVNFPQVTYLFSQPV